MSGGFRALEYEALPGPLSGVHPLAKATGLLALSLLSARAGSASLAASASFAIAGALLSGLRLGDFVADGAFLVWTALVLLPARILLPGDGRIFAHSAAPQALMDMARLLVAFVHAEVFYKTTELSALSDAVSGLWRKLSRRKEADPGIYAGIALLSLPRALSRIGQVLDAARSRGYGAKAPPFRSLASLASAMTRTCLDDAFRRLDALDARSYDPGRTLRTSAWGAVEAACAGIPALALALAAVLGV